MIATLDSSIWPATIEIGAEAGLLLGGCSLTVLAKAYGTPLYVLDEEGFRRNCQHFMKAASAVGETSSAVKYAAKAFFNVAVARLLHEQGFGLDVVSGGELAIAQRAAFPMGHVAFHGNAKTREELDLALSNGVGSIVVDNLDELRLLSHITADARVSQCIGLRIEPGIPVETHAHIQTGQINSKFGLPMDALPEVAAILRGSRGLRLNAIHCHLGSQITSIGPYLNALGVLLDAATTLQSLIDSQITTLVPGGGFAVAYRAGEPALRIDDALPVIRAFVGYECARRGLPQLRLGFEPGRAIAASAVVALYRVIASKRLARSVESTATRFIHVDGGLGDNVRPALYNARYSAIIANRPLEEPTETVHIAGRYCESGDILVCDADLPAAQIGDFIAIPMAGAYTLSMASNYNAVGRPAVVRVQDGRASLIQRRETYDDLLARDVG